tara:strand:+ start:247 stop:1359 length:1113 start_codon:yes stop_codon:yes gene_type:complete
VEVFSGAFWTYIQSDEIYKKVDKVIYNDVNPYMTNLFRCASDPKTFSKFIDEEKIPRQKRGYPELSKPCKEFFDKCKRELFDGDTDAAIKKITKTLCEDPNLDTKQIVDQLRKLREELKIIKDEDEKNIELTNQSKEERINSIKDKINKLLTEKKCKLSARAIKLKEKNELIEKREKNNNDLRDKFGEQIANHVPDQKAAMRYAYILTCSFSGINPVYSEFQDYKGEYGSKFQAFYNRLTSDKFIPRLEKIDTCENMSFEEVIKDHDSPTTYFYCDPPYWNTESYYSLHGFGEDEHKQLKKLLTSDGFKGKFALSYYDFPQLSDMYPEPKFRWERKEFVKPAGAKEGMKQSTGEEVLIMNYPKKVLDKTE